MQEVAKFNMNSKRTFSQFDIQLFVLDLEKRRYLYPDFTKGYRYHLLTATTLSRHKAKRIHSRLLVEEGT